MAGRLEAVLPLTLADLARSEILRTSLDRFFGDLGTCWVVVPDRDLKALARAIAGPRYQLLPESTLVPELQFYKRARAAVGRDPHLGWYAQQIIKLGIAEYVSSDFYLTLDADVICVRPVRSADLISNQRARSKRYTDVDVHRGWYRCAAKLLGLPRSRSLHHPVTPCLLSREAVLDLQANLSARVAPVARTLARLLPRSLSQYLASWRSYLLRNLGWSEYALYHTFLEGTNRWDHYHYEEGSTGIAWNSVWERNALAGWSPAQSFQGEGNFFFTVVQSNTDVPVLEVWEKVRAHVVGEKARV